MSTTSIRTNHPEKHMAELGYYWRAEEPYPGRQKGYFATRWFDTNLEEIGGYIPSLGTLTVWPIPRTWGPLQLEQLVGWKRYDDQYDSCTMKG